MPLYLTTEQVRRLHNLRSRQAVATAIREGRLRAIRVGRRWRIPIAAAARFRVHRINQRNGRRHRPRSSARVRGRSVST